MRSNRGSAAVISIVFMMFLLIIGIGFIPLMSSEVKHASMDMDEQKAWYAAEAGIKYVKAYQTDAAEIKANLGTDINLSGDSNTAGYKLTMKDKTDKSPVTSDTSSFPVADRTYIVYSEGTFNGVKKVITGDFVFSTSSSSGGESGGGSEETVALPGLIQTEGTVVIRNSNNKIDGSIYGNDFQDTTGNQLPTKKGVYSGQSTTDLKTKIPDSVFSTSSYNNLQELTTVTKASGSSVEANNTPLSITASNPVYITWPIRWSASWGSGVFNYQITGESGSLLFINVPSSVSSIYLTNGIVGPTSGKPLTIILNNTNTLTLDTTISGNVRIFSAGSINVAAKGDISGLLMLVTNGDIIFNAPVEYAFLSSNGNITLNSSCNLFVGQIQAAGTVDVYSKDLYYDNRVANSDGFTLPNGMK